MSDDTKAVFIDWTKVFVGIAAQLAIGVGVVFTMRAEIEVLKRDVAEVRQDVRRFNEAAWKMEGQSRALDLLSAQGANLSERISKIEQGRRPG